MSIVKEAEKECKKLSEEISERQRRLKALENILREYKVEFHPSTAKIFALVIECLREHQGHAKFGEIVDYLTLHDIKIPRQRISIALTKSDTVKFNRASEQWEMILPESGEAGQHLRYHRRA